MKKIIAFVVLMLAFVGCTSFQKKEALNLKGKEFQLVSLYPQTQITLGFEGDRFYGFSGVNRYFGEYKTGEGNSINLINPAATKMAGPEELMKQEDSYLNYLVDAKRVELEDKVLTITTKDGKTLEFKEIK